MKLTSLLLISILFFVLGCSQKSDEMIVLAQDEAKAINLLTGKWNYVHEYIESPLNKSRVYFPMNQRNSFNISNEDIVYQNAPKEDTYPTTKYTFSGKGKVSLDRTGNKQLDAFFYAAYTRKIDFKLQGARMHIFEGLSDTLRIEGISDYYYIFVKEK